MKLKSKPMCCPYCGCETYYRKVRFSGSGSYYRRFDGAPADNTELHDPLNYTEGKTMYCGDCNKSVGQVGDAREGDETA